LRRGDRLAIRPARVVAQGEVVAAAVLAHGPAACHAGLDVAVGGFRGQALEQVANDRQRERVVGQLRVQRFASPELLCAKYALDLT